MEKFLAPKSGEAIIGDEHQYAVRSISDDISQVEITTPSARRVKDLVEKSGREYADGELDYVKRGWALTGSEIPSKFLLILYKERISLSFSSNLWGKSFRDAQRGFFQKGFRRALWGK